VGRQLGKEKVHAKTSVKKLTRRGEEVGRRGGNAAAQKKPGGGDNVSDWEGKRRGAV